MGQLMERRVLGEEKIVFVDGSEKVIKIHAVVGRKVNQFRTDCKKTIYNDKGKVTDLLFRDDEFVYKVLSYSLSKNELTEFDLENNVETDVMPIFKKYFSGYISDSKKSSTSDASEEK